MLNAADWTIADDNGYEVLPAHLEFLGLTADALANMKRHSCPLGMADEDYLVFCRTLSVALQRDSVSKLQIRLQGSSARFFSGYHKEMPWSRGEIIELFRTGRGKVPTTAQDVDSIEQMIASVWPHTNPRPIRRPFDSMFRLGIDRYPSDYDIQISSDEVLTKAKAHLYKIGADINDDTLFHEKYRFVRKDLIEAVCPRLTRWALRQSTRLKRGVTIAAFPSDGPPKTNDKLSAHHQASDWLIR